MVPLTEDDQVDFANMQNAPWGDGSSSQSFFELYGEAQGCLLYTSIKLKSSAQISWLLPQSVV